MHLFSVVVKRSLQLSTLCRYGDLCLSRQTTDVIMLRGVSTIPYTYIDKERVVFRPQLTASDNQLQPNTEFYTVSSKRYHKWTPMHIILKESFYLKYKELTYFVVRNQPTVDVTDNDELFVKYGGVTIESLIKAMLSNLPKKETGKGFHNYLIRQILEESQSYKFRRISLERLIQIVERKLQCLDRSWQPVEMKLKRRGERVAFLWMTFLGIQMVVVNWCVYFYLSWDIMEPITVLLANMELLLAYSFFVYHKKEFTYKKISETTAEKKRHDRMRRESFDLRKYQQLSDTLQYLKMLLTLIDGQPQAVVKMLQKNTKLLDDQ